MNLTDEERRAIDALRRIARRWPKTLMVVECGGTLHVKRRSECSAPDLSQVPNLAILHGIPANSWAI